MSDTQVTDDVIDADAPATDAPTDAPTTDARANLRAQVAAQAQAAKTETPRFAPAPGFDWAPVPTGGQVCTCLSRPNARGEAFHYLVYRTRGKDIAIPLSAIYAAEEAGQF